MKHTLTLSTLLLCGALASVPVSAGGPETATTTTTATMIKDAAPAATAVINGDAVTMVKDAATAMVKDEAAAIVKDAAPAATVMVKDDPVAMVKDEAVTMVKEAAPAAAAIVKVDAPVQSYDSFTQILQTYGDDSRDVTLFDYAALSGNAADMQALDAYIKELGSTPAPGSENEALAYWANIYNAVTVQVVAQNWPVDSIKDIKSNVFKPGPWDRKLVTVNGKTLSLNDIEHGIMREDYDEPRVHYMVNCASIGCPNLRLVSWSGDTLEEDLNVAAGLFVNSERGVSVNNGRLAVSSIYSWFSKDFGRSDANVIAHLKTYADGELAAQLSDITKISSNQYDWSVNAPK